MSHHTRRVKGCGLGSWNSNGRARHALSPSHNNVVPLLWKILNLPKTRLVLINAIAASIKRLIKYPAKLPNARYLCKNSTKERNLSHLRSNSVCSRSGSTARTRESSKLLMLQRGVNKETLPQNQHVGATLQSSGVCGLILFMIGRVLLHRQVDGRSVL